MAITPITSAKEQFDRQAAHYNEQWASWSDETLRRMLELANPQPGWRVLDVATGTGFTALAFARYVREVVGTDISPKMLEQAAKRAREQGIRNAAWQEASAEWLPFPHTSFDLITCRIAPHHFASVQEFLKECYRVLKPNSLLVIGDTAVPDGKPAAADWQNRVEWERDNSHVRNLSPNEWRERAAEAGFVVTDVEYRPGAITIPLSQWLETSGTVGDQADRVRRWFSNAPESAREEFRIATDPLTEEVTFSWARVLLRAMKFRE